MSKTKFAAAPAEPPSRLTPIPPGQVTLQEFGDVKDVLRTFGFRQSHLLHLEREKLIVSYLVKGRGAGRGKRLYDFNSIRRLLASSPSNITNGQ